MKRSANTDPAPRPEAAPPPKRRRAAKAVPEADAQAPKAPKPKAPPRPKAPAKPKAAPKPRAATPAQAAAPATDIAPPAEVAAKPPRRRAPRAKPAAEIAPPPPPPRLRERAQMALTAWLARRTARPQRWWRLANKVPAPILTVLLLVVIAAGVITTHFAHWTLRKPAVLLTPLSGTMIKTPAQTWEAYGPLFRRHATAFIPAELLAALAQMESAGDPVAATYWRWNENAPDFFGIFRPASTSVGLYQMTDPAFAEARRYCVRDHKVVTVASGGCGETPPDLRLLPSHAIELTAAWLDRGVARALGGHAANAAQSADVAALTHLCGGQVARAYVGRDFQLTPEQKCGDHSPAAYLAQVRGLQQTFRRLATR